MPTTRCSTIVLTSCSTQFRHARVNETPSEPFSEPDHPIRLAQQQRAGIRRDRPAIKRCYHPTPIHRCKFEQCRATLCRHWGAPLLQQKAFVTEELSPIQSPSA